MEMRIYIGQMWRQIIFAKFIESCNFALKDGKLKSFFDSYISHDFLDSFVYSKHVKLYLYKFFEFYSYISHDFLNPSVSIQSM